MLRPLEPEDLALLCGIENAPEVWETTTTACGAAPYSRFALKEYIARAAEASIFESGEQRFVIEEGGKAVGLIDLARYAPLSGTAEVCIAVLREERSRGVATRALAELEEYAARFLRMRSLCACIPEALSPMSMQLFRSAGYAERGRLKEWLYARGTLHDVVLMQKHLAEFAENEAKSPKSGT